MPSLTDVQAKALLEAKSRRIDALSLIRLLPHQEEAIRKMSLKSVVEVLVSGGNRCLHGSQTIYDPVTKMAKRVDEIDGDFHVCSVSPATGKAEIKASCRPFIKGYGEFLRVTMSNGEVIVVTPEHRVVSRSGVWLSIRDAWVGKEPLASVSHVEGLVFFDEQHTTIENRKVSQECPPSQARSSTSSFPRALRRLGNDASAEPLSYSEQECLDQEVPWTREARYTQQSSRSASVSSFVTSKAHAGQCLLETGKRKPVGFASSLRLTTLGTCASMFPTGATSCSQTPLSSRYYCRPADRSCDALPHSLEVFFQGVFPSLRDALAYTLPSLRADDQACESTHSHAYQQFGHLSNCRETAEIVGRSCASEHRQSSTIAESGFHSLRNAWLSHASAPHCISEKTRRTHQAEVLDFEASHPSLFAFDDTIESVHITSVESMGEGPVWDISVEEHANYILRPDVNATAVVNANSGKSVLVACWLSSYLRDKPITMSDGSLFYARPERFRGRSVLVWGIGINWNHIGDNMYRLLFRAGEFDIIRDEATGRWRVATKEDKRENVKPSPPFIPHSEIAEDSWDWENKKAKQLHSVTFKNDESRLVFYPSTADLPSQGDKVHAIWIDENIDNPDHYTEWQMRVSDLDGQVVWSAWPTNQPNPAMNGLMERGNAQADLDDPQTLYFRFRGSDNPFSTTKTRSYVLSTMSDEESAARDTGEVDMNAWLMYPRFRPALHQALGKFSEDDDPNDKFAKALRANHGDVPHDWTRYLILDPGTVHPAVLMCAVPPPNLGDYVLAYNEVYGKRMDADQLAEKVLEETFSQVEGATQERDVPIRGVHHRR